MVHRTGRQCRFQLIRPLARRVYLVGDFNDWSRTAIQMTARAGGLWETTLDLPPGTYKFRYYVDDHWVTDFAAFGIERNRLGEWDSVLYIPASENPDESLSNPTEPPSNASARLSMHNQPVAPRSVRPPLPGLLPTAQPLD